MSWPIGYARAGAEFEFVEGRGLFANGVLVTDPDGWIELPSPLPGAAGRTALGVQIRVAPDANGAPFIYAERVYLGARHYSGVHALAMAQGGGWIAHLARAIPAELARRVAAREATQSGSRPTLDPRRDQPLAPGDEATMRSTG